MEHPVSSVLNGKKTSKHPVNLQLLKYKKNLPFLNIQSINSYDEKLSTVAEKLLSFLIFFFFL